MNKLVSGAIGVQVNLRSGVNRIHFPEIIYLRKKRIKHIDVCYGGAQCTITPDGTNILAASNYSKLFITLVEDNTKKELIRSLPINQLGLNGNRLFIDKIVDLQASYIDISAITDPATIANKCLYFVFWYDEPAVWGVVDANGRTAIEPLEITLTGKTTRFAENINLKNKRVQNLLLTFPSVTPSGKSGINAPNVANKYLTLSYRNTQFFGQIPLYLFIQEKLFFQLRLQNIVFDLQSSFIETIGVTADDLKTLFFNVLIDDSPKTISRR